MLPLEMKVMEILSVLQIAFDPLCNMRTTNCFMEIILVRNQEDLSDHKAFKVHGYKIVIYPVKSDPIMKARSASGFI
jgi:hypothetical protein